MRKGRILANFKYGWSDSLAASESVTLCLKRSLFPLTRPSHKCTADCKVVGFLGRLIKDLILISVDFLQVRASASGLPGSSPQLPLPQTQLQDHLHFKESFSPESLRSWTAYSPPLLTSSHGLFASSVLQQPSLSTSRASPVPLSLPSSLRIFSTVSREQEEAGKAGPGGARPAVGGQDRVGSQPLGKEKDPAAAKVDSEEEKPVADLQILGTLSVYLWPKDRPDFKRRVAFALSLLVASKASWALPQLLCSLRKLELSRCLPMFPVPSFRSVFSARMMNTQPAYVPESILEPLLRFPWTISD